MNLMKELYNYRELLKTNIKKDIRGKYKGSWLGVIWTFLNPLLQLLVYSFVFPFILRINVENYTIFMIFSVKIFYSMLPVYLQNPSGCLPSLSQLRTLLQHLSDSPLSPQKGYHF